MRILSSSALIALSFSVSACGATTDNRSVDSVHQPVIQRTDYVLDVTTGGDGLAPGEAQRLRGWFDTMHVAYGDKIAMDAGENGGSDAARLAIAQVAGQHGLVVEPRAPLTQGSIAPGAVRVIVSRTTASVPGCPDFHTSLLAKFNATTSPNYGCATNATLAAMIADPEDLVRGRDGRVEGSTTVGTNAVRAYQKAIATQADTTTTAAH